MTKPDVIAVLKKWAQVFIDDQLTTRTTAEAMKERDEILGYVEKHLPEPRRPDSPALMDHDPMPWGKYKGVEMHDVPASYMFWLWTQKGFENELENHWNPVADYIRRNLAAFEKDYPDGIWRK